MILTAGGYVHNKTMLERYAPVTRRVRFRLGCDGDDGRGIRMGMGAGGDAIRMEAACIVVPFSRNRQFVKGVLVNASGQRFCAEDLYQSLLGEIGMWRQDGRIWLVLDDALFEKPQLPTEILAVGDTFEELEAEAKIFPKGSLVHDARALQRGRRARARIRCSARRRAGSQPLATPPYVVLDLSLEKYPFWSAFTLGGLHTRPDRRGARPGRRDRARASTRRAATPRACPRTATTAGSRSRTPRSRAGSRGSPRPGTRNSAKDCTPGRDGRMLGR